MGFKKTARGIYKETRPFVGPIENGLARIKFALTNSTLTKVVCYLEAHFPQSDGLSRVERLRPIDLSNQLLVEHPKDKEPNMAAWTATLATNPEIRKLANDGGDIRVAKLTWNDSNHGSMCFQPTFEGGYASLTVNGVEIHPNRLVAGRSL